MLYKTIIVDDEFPARKRISELLKEDDDFELINMYATGHEAIRGINATQPDVIFLDINLKDMSGIEILSHISQNSNFAVVFVTAYDKYAIEAFNLHAIDYLLKPYKDHRFFECLSKLKTNFTKYDKQPIKELIDYIKYKSSHQDKLLVPQNDKTILLDSNKIKYIISSSYYAEIHTNDDKKLVIRGALKNILDNLNPEVFFRVHRSTIVNISYANELIHSGMNETDIKMNDQKIFRISKSYKADFLKKIGIKL